jgi:hypothetical protein
MKSLGSWEQTATHSMANATYFEMVPDTASRYSPALPQWGGVFTYHSERLKTRAIHIQSCPVQVNPGKLRAECPGSVHP